MKYRLLFLSVLTMFIVELPCYSQAVKNLDGSPLVTTYCLQDKNFGIIGQPAGGTFSGCGISQQNGTWIFNPAVATANTTVFPYQCLISYTVNNTTVNIPFTVSKPVIINPPLQDSFTCNGNFFLHATTLYAGAYDYSWSPAHFLSTPDTSVSKGNITTTQTFVLTATDASSGCVGTDTVTIIKDSFPEIIVSPDTTILPRSSVPIIATGAFTYEWSPAKWLDNPNTATPFATPEEDITYTVTGKSEYGCANTAGITIRLNNNIFVPNAFSPNGDGMNDIFHIINYGFDEIMEFRVFDRWGKEVFSTQNGLSGWDGNYKGMPMSNGTYFYSIKIAYKNKPERIIKGDLTLIR